MSGSISNNISNVKRVLWIDDYPNNKAGVIFNEEETRIVSSMDDAIKEISGERLYDYDSIVLDIDFENGIKNADEVIEKLSKVIYLNKDQKEKSFIINNGGYLLFLYLLEKGYPSKQVAFLTGNSGIIGQLKAYNRQNEKQMSKEDIVNAFIDAWKEFGEDVDEFENYISELPIDKKYKDSDFVYDCAFMIDEGDMDGLTKMVGDITPTMVTGSVQNTGDMMIFRFHEANLESPVYFSKNDNDIQGHNREDAKKWLDKNRTDSKISRWLILNAGDYVEKLFRQNTSDMNRGIGRVLRNISNDGGIRSAFRQMYYVFDGLRNVEHRGVYYQAVSAMLVPFDATPGNGGDNALSAVQGLSDDERIMRMFASCAKQARNYCAHNSMGSSISDRTTLFLLMIAVNSVLNKTQRHELAWWYKKCCEVINNDIGSTNTFNINKIDTLIAELLSNNKIDINCARVGTDCTKYTPKDLLYALGYNTQMNTASQPDSAVREEYFVFTLATYVVKWLDGVSESDMDKRFGREICMVYDVSKKVVASYLYPVI